VRVNGSFKDSGGLRVESVFAQRFAFMFATVRKRPQPFARAPYGRAYGKFRKRGRFGGFTCGVASFRVAGVALRDIPKRSGLGNFLPNR